MHEVTLHDVKLARREEVALGTMAFHFSKPAGFAFQPGQAVDVVLPVDKDERRTFSLVSAPFQDELVVATRMRDSAFKRALKALPRGSAVRIEGPSGSLVLHEDRARAAVFIAGGIGITPFMSILRQAARDRLPQRLLLLYSNRRPEDAAFLAELQELERRNKSFRLVATMTEMAKSALPWDGETGLVDAGLIRRYAHDLPKPIYYIVGPPGMVEAMQEVLHGAGVGGDDIRTEEFYGY
jgi:ferredoxin-NADP reductase